MIQTLIKSCEESTLLKLTWVIKLRYSQPTSSRIHQFRTTFEPQYLWNVSSKWDDFLDLQKYYKTQHLVSKTMMKLFSFLCYLTLKFLENYSDRQEWCENHNLKKWSKKCLYYKKGYTQNVSVFLDSPGEK